MNPIRSIIKYQVQDTFRNKWLIVYTFFYLILTYALLSFTSDPSKVVLSLLNVNLIVIPLASLIFGTIYLYNNKDYIMFILSQPVDRKTLYFGLYLGLSISMAFSFLLGTVVPIIIFAKMFTDSKEVLISLLAGGVFETFIFVSISFLIATINDNKMKGLGIAIFCWLFLSALYDGIILFLLQVFKEYPLEVPSIVLTLCNPVDLSRILVILKFDISAMMGYTGAVFSGFFGGGLGTLVSLISLILWTLLPLLAGMKVFIRKDF